LARQLLVSGHEALLIAWRTPHCQSSDCRVQSQACDALGIETMVCCEPQELDQALGSLDQAVHLVDALLGTGLTSPLRSDAAEWLDRAESLRQGLGCPCWAIDLPSGMDGDLGTGAVLRSQRTLTLGALKVGLGVPAAREYTGVIDVLDLGIPARVLQMAQGRIPGV
jgi:NAD(P)H-hydrate repair Nnr-like enzyme with NAD(P)H-hydrate epimerase domain